MLRISPSMLDSHHWYMNSDFSTREEYLNRLNKIYTPPNERMQMGIDFEHYVCNYPKMKGTREGRGAEEYDLCASQCYDKIKGGVFQQKIRKVIEFSGEQILITGVPDVIIRNEVIDIKFVKSYDIGKYEYSAQWRTYLWMTGLESFTYLISNGKDVWEEYYSNSSNVEVELKSLIGKFLLSLENDFEAKDAYYRNWRS